MDEQPVSKAGPPLVGKVIPAAKVKNKLALIPPPKPRQMYKGDSRYHRVMRVFLRDQPKAIMVGVASGSLAGGVGGLAVGRKRNKLTRQRAKETQRYRQASLGRVSKRVNVRQGMRMTGRVGAYKIGQAADKVGQMSLGRQMLLAGAATTPIGLAEASYRSRLTERATIKDQKSAVRQRQRINARRTKKGKSPIQGELKMIPSYRQTKKAAKVSKSQEISGQDRRALKRLGYLGAAAGLTVAGAKGISGGLRLANRAKTPMAIRRSRIHRARRLDQVANIAGGVGAGTGGLLAIPLIDQREYRKKSAVRKAHSAFLTEEQISKVFDPERNRSRREKTRSAALAGGALALGGSEVYRGRQHIKEAKHQLKYAQGNVKEGKAGIKQGTRMKTWGSTDKMKARGQRIVNIGVQQKQAGRIGQRIGLKMLKPIVRPKQAAATGALLVAAGVSEKHRRGQGAKTYNKRYF